MLLEKYFNAVDDLLITVKDKQKDNIEKAGQLIVESVTNGGAVHIFDCGHIIDSELIERGGGLMLFKPFKYSLTINNPVRPRNRNGIDKSMEGLAAYALKASNVMPGDVMILASVSGKGMRVVDLAFEAKKLGVKIIALTSVEYSSQVKSEHSSGMRLFELGDVVLNNCAPAGEAMLEVEGLESKICAASGISAAFIMWSVTVVIIEKLLKKGIIPSVFKSANFPGGAEYNAVLREKYKESGF